MSNQLTALMFGAGFGCWIYAMMMRRTGSNTKTSLIVAGLAALTGWFVIYTTLDLVFG